MRRFTRFVLVVFSVVCCASLLGPFAAPEAPSTPGSLRVEQPDGALLEMPLRHTSVQVEITAFVARAVIEQTFGNPFDRPVEAVYTFPLGDRAAVDDFEFIIGDRTIRGEIRRREEARRVYEEARSAGYQAALLEQERPNIFTQSVANLEPGVDVKVRIRMVETLRYEKGIYAFTFPLVVGPRYVPGRRAPAGPVTTGKIPPTRDVPDADGITPPYLRPEYRSGHDVEIEVRLEAGVPIADISSPSHRILPSLLSKTSAEVRLAPDDRLPNKDFMLRWSVSSETPEVGLLTHRDGVDGFFTLLVQPKGEVTAQEAAPKEIVFVLDTSGSMSGVPLKASKRLMKKALRTLGRNDTFNLVRFAGSAETLSAEPLPNDARSIERATEWLGNLRGGGGTEMLSGFRAAFALPADPDRVRIVVFLTDGYIGNEAQILDAIGEVVGEARVFTLGIGSSVNHYLLDRMAELGDGAYVFVRPDGHEEEAVERFRSWVTKPYLTDLEIDWGALPVADMVPERPRDLFSGQTLTVVGRYLGAGEGEIVVHGKLGGRYWEQRQHVVLPDREKANAALASLWARHRIVEVLLSSPGGTPPSVEAEVTSLALEFRLMSPFTSFVAVDDSRVVNPGGESETIHQAIPVPEGVSFEGVFGSCGPAALKEPGADGQTEGDEETLPEDARFDGVGDTDTRFGDELRARHFKTVVGGVSSARATSESKKRADVLTEEVTVVSAGSRVEYGGAQGGYATVEREVTSPLVATNFSTDLPVQGRVYTNVIMLAPGIQDGDGGPNVHGARQRDFSAGVRVRQRLARMAIEAAPQAESAETDSPLNRAMAERLRDAALRVLADLAEDGRLSSAEGRPSLAALMAAQTPLGAVARDVRTHALATWALAEASAALPGDPWIRAASEKATAYLKSLVGEDGWPARPGASADSETTRWASLVLRWILKDESPRVAAPGGEPSPEYAQLRAAIARARTGEPAAPPAGRGPFDRLIGAIASGYLQLAG